MILQSASKIVFILIAVTACIGFGVGRLDAKDFMVLAMAAFSYYFSIQTPGRTDESKEIKQ